MYDEEKDRSFDQIEDVETPVPVRANDSPTVVEISALPSPFLSKLALDRTFEPPYFVQRGTTKALRIVRDCCRLPNAISKELLKQHIAKETERAKCSKILLEVVETAYLLEMNRIFAAGCEMFQALISSLNIGWPITLDHLGIVASKLHSCLYGYPRPQFDPRELRELQIVLGNPIVASEDMSHSTQFDLAWRHKIGLVDPLEKPKWEPDEATLICPDCQRAFTMLWIPVVRRSHCRICGRLKCSDCTNYVVPRHLALLARDTDGTTCRVCESCFKYTDRSSHGAFLSALFTKSNFNIVQLYQMLLVSSEFFRAARSCLNDYRQIFYIPLFDPMSPATITDSVFGRGVRNIVLASAKLFAGHPPAILALFAVTNWTDTTEGDAALRSLEKTVILRQRRQPMEISHWHLLCSRTCGTPFYPGEVCTPFFGLQLLHVLREAPMNEFTKRAQDIAYELIALGKFSPSAFAILSAVLPQLLDLMRVTHMQLGIRTLIDNIVHGDMILQMFLYRELCSRRHTDNFGESRALAHMFSMMKSDIEKAPTFNSDELHRVSALIEAIAGVDAEDDDVARRKLYEGLMMFNLLPETIQPLTSKGVPQSLPETIELRAMPYLFDPTIQIRGMKLSHVKVLNSQHHPLKVVLLENDMKSTRSILFKREDVRKDAIVCTIVTLLERLLQGKQVLRPSVVIPKYRVLPTSANSGVIEWVEDARSVEDLRRVNNPVAAVRPVETFLHSLPQNDELRNNFSCSAAFYTFLTYLLGVGDRHRGNVMVLSNGSILHVDFGFLINERPAIEKMTAKYVRFDLDLKASIECFFPERDPQRRLDRFFATAASFLLQVRPHADVLCLLLHHLAVHEAVTQSSTELSKFIMERLLVEKRDDEARREFIMRIKESMGDPFVQDRVHEAAQSYKKKGLMQTVWEGLSF